MIVNLALAEDFVGRLDIVLKGGLRVMRKEKRLMGTSHFVAFVANGFEIISEKPDRILRPILYHLKSRNDAVRLGLSRSSYASRKFRLHDV